ncbi:unnamed protein product, partial [Ectocarpus sp. 8 AP-2014]
VHCCEREIYGSLSINRCRSTAVDGSLLDALGRFSSGGPRYAISSLACLGVSGVPSFATRVQSNHTLLCASQKEKKVLLGSTEGMEFFAPRCRLPG